MKTTLLILIITLILPGRVDAGGRLAISEWLSTSPLGINYPVFHNTPDVEGNTFSDRRLLVFDHIDLKDYYPEEGKTLRWIDGSEVSWQRTATDGNAYVQIGNGDHSSTPEVTYLAAYINTGRWLKASLEVGSPYMFEAWLNGEKIGTKSTIEEKSKEDEDNDTRSSYGRISHNIELTKGNHLLVIKALRPPSDGYDWELSASLTPEEEFDITDISPGISPVNIKNIHHFMDGVKVSSVRPSPDGSLYAIGYRQSLPPSGRSESWTEIRRFSDEALVHSFRHAGISRLGWLPATNAVSYTAAQNGRTSVYVHNMETGEKRTLAEGLVDFGGMSWSPDESYIIYSVTEEGKGAGDTMRQILGMQDRQSHFRNRSFLYKLDVASGVKTRLTHGNLSTSLHDISPDGSRIVFSQSWPDYLERPFSKHTLFLMNMDDLSTDTLIAGKRWSVSVQFSPDGRSLLATGGPSAFDRIGENVPEGMIPNNYDTQAYIFDLEDHSVKPITIDFDPTIGMAYWHQTDDNIYFLAGDQDYQRLFRYNTRRERFERIDTGTDVISNISFASNARLATYIGNKANTPPAAYTINTRNNNWSVLEDFEAGTYRHVSFGEVHDWNFTASTGVEISGRYYLPPDFDPEEQYPVIVYQYGGTTPVGRSFGGRYPFNLWAGNGYIVYILQPSGAIGYGQEFSAAHVNNWGKTVVDEIIEGTDKFLKAHPYADPERVGVAGASYGGFMTMLLLTHTDIFATGISHAGISNIASYWGEGYWGYSYSAEASAGSFPWDSPELYIDQSPLYRADSVNTPLLLITGDSDTNVPPGESIQMYTALKLLGKPAELILVEGEDHHILTYSKRLKWHDTMMAWWDRYLKEQPEWWFELYPEKNY